MGLVADRLERGRDFLFRSALEEIDVLDPLPLEFIQAAEHLLEHFQTAFGVAPVLQVGQVGEKLVAIIMAFPVSV